MKIFAYSDSPTAATGFGNAAAQIYIRLHEKYGHEFRILGVNYHGEHHKLPFFIHGSQDPADPYAMKQFARILKSGDKPDLIFLFQDIYIIGGYSGGAKNMIDQCREVYPDVPVVIYVPIDGDPLCKKYYEDVIKKADTAIVISKYGAEVIKEIDPGAELLQIYHGIDTSVFRELDAEERLSAKRQFCQDEDRFLIVNVNRFQPRKNVPATMRAVALFRNGYKVCGECGNYYGLSEKRCDLNGCNSVSKIVKGHPETALYLHMSGVEPSMGVLPADRLSNHMANAGFGSEDKAVYIPAPSFLFDNISLHDVNRIYNAADLFISTTLGEGFGFCAVEAAASGTPVILPKNTTGVELLPSASFVKNSTHFVMARDSGIMRPLVSVPGLVDAIQVEYEKWIMNGREKVISGELMDDAERFNWDDIAEEFDSAFSASKKKESPIGIFQI